MHERGGLANLRCRKVSFHGLADWARLQDARGRWIGEFSVPEIKLARVRRSPQCYKRHERSGSANLRCKKLNSHGLTDPARLKEASARWLGELAVQDDMVARGTSEVAR
ncbi:hypothetical protein CDL15_Pgr002282 [Punica granatum]|uniref:Uncharacterized protein n=1 Tax=Punica granatum TaxID=22663 RepID=A0A218XHJ3_PUNGR|nr:hypothetical protein CDL15_Pgr002282 [Punica granatum]